MYYYYAIVAAFPGIKIWWKKHLTTFQIIQFVVDLSFIYYCMYVKHIGNGDCQGDRAAGNYIDLSLGWAGTALISSYLYLFIEFFLKTYVISAPKRKVD
jgi:fatty acid elongase 3